MGYSTYVTVIKGCKVVRPETTYEEVKISCPRHGKFSEPVLYCPQCGQRLSETKSSEAFEFEYVEGQFHRRLPGTDLDVIVHQRGDVVYVGIVMAEFSPREDDDQAIADPVPKCETSYIAKACKKAGLDVISEGIFLVSWTY